MTTQVRLVLGWALVGIPLLYGAVGDHRQGEEPLLVHS